MGESWKSPLVIVQAKNARRWQAGSHAWPNDNSDQCGLRVLGLLMLTCTVVLDHCRLSGEALRYGVRVVAQN